MSVPMNGRERIMREDDFIVSKTDLKGKITYCNEIFMDMAAMTESELLGKPHSIVRHPDMPKAVFKLLWDRIKEGKEVFAYVKNQAKDGNYYWVLANVTPSYDENGRPIGFYSVRIKPSQKAIETIEPLYAQMREKERQGGIESSVAFLQGVLKEKGVTYDEFIVSLQG